MTDLACTVTADSFRCPTKWELWRQTMASLPPGRAWQGTADAPWRVVTGANAQVESFEVGSTPLAAEPVIEELTVLEQYWAAHAEVLEYLHTRACQLIDEFFCATAAEQLPEWWTDYGFPDECLPYSDLCAKVAAQGDSRCAYFVAIAWARGWDVECLQCGPGPMLECNTWMDAMSFSCCPDVSRVEAPPQLMMDCSAVMDCVSFTDGAPREAIRVDLDHMHIRIHRATSPAYATPATRPMAEALVMDCTPFCEPGFEQVVCLIERLKPAHVLATYEVV